jgi:hypothetical protein
MAGRQPRRICKNSWKRRKRPPAFFETLAVQLGLVVTPGVRNVSVVVVRQN